MSPDSGAPVVDVESSLQLLRTMSEVLDIRGVFPRVSEIVRELLPHDHLQLTFLDKTGAVVMQARSTDGFPHYDRVTSTVSMAERREKGFVICGDLTQERMPIAEPADLQDRIIAAGFRSFLAIFASAREQAMTLSFVSKRANAFSPDDLPVARRIADYIALAVSHEQLAEAERRVAEAHAREEQLRASEQELRGIVDAIPQLVVVRKPDGTFLYANRSVLEYSGFTVEEVMAQDFRTEFVHPEDRARLHEERREGLSRTVPFEIEQRLRRKDGQYRWFVVHYHPLRDDQGQILRWYGTGTDIDERKRAEERMRNETLALREDIDRASMFEEIVGSSPPLQRVLAQAAKVATTDATVLILGETGTGKELAARAIHRRSGRSARAFIRVNCAAIPPSLIASELFGHEKGAFTGALQRRLGRFEAADGGTIFLDEVGDLPPETQISLLRVLQEREIERVGSSHPIPIDVRVLAATNRDLEPAVASGAFRQDLYFRLNVFPIRMPPLRERVDDVQVLVEYLVERYAKGAGKTIRHITKHTLELLQAYDWPGNVRELQNVIERAVVLCEGETFVIDESWLKAGSPQASKQMGRQVTTLAQSEKAMIEAALAETNGRVSGPNGAAAKLGIPRQTLQSKIKALHIDKLAYQKR